MLKRLRWPLLLLAGLWVWARWGPMDPLFTTPRSTVLLDRDGALLGATVASDGQWRMPSADSIPGRFERCLIEFEDRRFRHHWGIRLPSLARAWQQNRRAGRTVRGGSTITMQVARMSMANRDRSVWNKLREMALALRLEVRMSKDEILLLHASNAPFGGNVVGLEAAAWRWFGKPPHQLGWAECATLAVLPNAPARMHPGKNRAALRAKRDRLLHHLVAVQAIDSTQWSLALEEPLPDAPHPLPRLAPQLLNTLQARGMNGQRIGTTIDGGWQRRITDLTARYGSLLRANEVHNAAVLVLDVASGDAIAYVGNMPGSERHGEVDVVRAPRSTGSLLKPFLYAAMLQAGERMPDQLVADLPTSHDGFAPRNYDERYSGAVPASAALARSLNVPAVRALREHGVERARRMFVGMGLDHLGRSGDHYGLSLIVGGGESTLWELTGAYASLARVVLRFTGDDRSVLGAVHPPRVLAQPMSAQNSDAPPLGAGALYHALIALQQVNRPEQDAGWSRFEGQERIAWKTGTSFGHRDAWAIGVTDRYAVGVWTGNASGEGRPGLTGSLAAAPLLFDVFGALPDGQGFDPPHDALQRMEVCPQSGHRAGDDCPQREPRLIVREAERTAPCPYHRRILVNAAGDRRVMPSDQARTTTWFVLPPAMEFYYAPEHPAYKPMPPWADGQAPASTHDQPIQMIYPEQGASLFIPVELSGAQGRLVMRAAHRSPAMVLHWDLDGEYLGSTVREHQIAVAMRAGEHQLTLTDSDGARLGIAFKTASAEGKR